MLANTGSLTESVLKRLAAISMAQDPHESHLQALQLLSEITCAGSAYELSLSGGFALGWSRGAEALAHIPEADVRKTASRLISCFAGGQSVVPLAEVALPTFWKSSRGLNGWAIARRDARGECFGAWLLTDCGETDATFLHVMAGVLSPALDHADERHSISEIQHNHERALNGYRGFVNELAEGVWCLEVEPPIPREWDVDRQIEALLSYGRIVECNPAMARMLGSRVKEVIGQKLSAFFDPRKDCYIGLLRNFVRANYHVSRVEWVQEHGGVSRHYANSMVGIVDDGYFHGMWGTQQDIEHYKMAEHRLTDAASKAAAANLAKSNFLASVSHEIRTPLGVIMGFADLVLERSNLEPVVRTYVSTIHRNGRQLMEILGEVLDLSKIEAERMDLEMLPVSLATVLEEVRQSMQVKSEEKDLELQIHQVGPMAGAVMTDPTRIRQILINLIGNAIKFTERGKVTVTASAEIDADQSDQIKFQFFVADTGMGIDADAQARLFTPFTQADSAISRKYGGTGLGLTLSQKLARALGGDLILRSSRPGEGSCFAFHFRAERAENSLVSAPVEKGSHAEVDFSGKRVLLVEDCEDNRNLIVNLLAPLGLQVDIAHDGAEGLEMAQGDLSYDLILMDLHMPRMDGQSAMENLRQTGFSRPIIALTANAFRASRENACATGFDDYLTKPINLKVFLNTLATRLLMH